MKVLAAPKMNFIIMVTDVTLQEISPNTAMCPSCYSGHVGLHLTGFVLIIVSFRDVASEFCENKGTGDTIDLPKGTQGP